MILRFCAIFFFKTPVDKNQLGTNKLLTDIIHTIEVSSRGDIIREYLVSSAGPTSPPTLTDHSRTMDERHLSECLYYLQAYGTSIAVVNFYRRHGHWQKAARYILEKVIILVCLSMHASYMFSLSFLFLL